MPAYRWEVAPPIDPQVRAVLGDFHPLTAQLLANRGLADRAGALAFLTPGEGPTYDPFHLPDLAAAVDRLLHALRQGEPVVVYGDFDADGITGTALLVQGLRRFGGVAAPYIPHRDTEGYGINTRALDRLRAEDARIIVAVDTGTSAVEEIAHAGYLGLDTIVLDHHAIPPQLPNALAVVNPHRPESRYPFAGLAGVGVAFKLLQALSLALGRPPEEVEDTLDLAAIGTVADLAPLTHENRWIAQRGLAALNRGERPGLRALVKAAGLQPGAIDAGDLGFMLAPRLNAMGRLDHAIRSYQLLCSQAADEAAALADVLEATNRERQRVTREAVEAALAGVGPVDGPLVMVAGPYPAGVIGLVASRLAEEFYLPSVVVEQGEALSRGSCRSIPDVSIVDLLRQCHDLFERYGGHPAAAGFTIRTERLPELRERLTEAAERALAGRRPQATLYVDAATPLRALPGPAMADLARLAPFGQGNPEPVFLTRGLAVTQKRALGAGGEHLELRLREHGATWRAMGFRLGGRIDEVPDRVDLVYTIGMDRFNGDGLLQLRIRDWRPAEPQAGP